jgi:hypothetical protein
LSSSSVLDLGLHSIPFTARLTESLVPPVDLIMVSPGRCMVATVKGTDGRWYCTRVHLCLPWKYRKSLVNC